MFFIRISPVKVFVNTHTCILALLDAFALTLTMGYLHLHSFTYKRSLGYFCAIVSIEVYV